MVRATRASGCRHEHLRRSVRALEARIPRWRALSGARVQGRGRHPALHDRRQWRVHPRRGWPRHPGFLHGLRAAGRLGHGNRAVRDAVVAAIDRGWSLGTAEPYSLALAECNIIDGKRWINTHIISIVNPSKTNSEIGDIFISRGNGHSS